MVELTAAIEAELEGTPELRELQREQFPFDPEDYPEPTQADIESYLEVLRTDFSVWHAAVREQRKVRFLKDRMPEKWAKSLEIGPDQHVHSRLGHNMVMRVVANATRNPPKYRVPPSDGKDKDQDRAQKQTRWLNNVWPAFERAKAKRRAVIDNQGGDGLGVIEIYRTGSYNGLDLERRDGEGDGAYLKRTEPLYKGARAPYGIRNVDPLSVFWDEDGTDDDPVCMAYIEEEVAAAPLWRALKRAKGPDEYAKFQEQRTRGKPGQPVYHNSNERPSNTVRCIRYYDRRWYAYIVDGVMCDGPTEHGMGFVPLVFYEGMTTGSPNRSERYQGVFWGMSDLELAINWLTTLEIDNAFTLSKPKIAITIPLSSTEAQRHIGSGSQAPKPVDFSGGKVPRLRPGEVPVNLTETFRGHDTAPVRQWLMQLVQISGLNPIAQGESPGSDPAGYAINALQSAAQANYEVLLDNAARGDAALGNKLRALIKRDLKQPWYLTAPMGARRTPGTAWLGLGPDDVDDTPCEVTIDPLSDVNRIAVQQAKRQGNKEGYIARWHVQEAYGIDDYELEDEDILEDTMEAELGRMAIEEAKITILEAQMMQQPQPSGLVDQFGNPLPASTQGPPQAAGATPAPPQPPTVGGDAGGASAAPFQTQPGAAAQSSSSALAGFDRGQRPPGTAA